MDNKKNNLKQIIVNEFKEIKDDLTSFESRAALTLMGLTVGVGILGGTIISGALVVYDKYIHPIEKVSEQNNYCDSTYYKDNSKTVLIDFDCDGSYDWKTVYTRKNGEMIKIETTAKESWYNKIGIQERRQFANIVSDTTKIN